MDQEQSGKMSPTSIVLIVLACVGLTVIVCSGVIVVYLVAITALGTSANTTFGTVSARIGSEISPEQAARQFLNDLGAGLTQAAWNQTSDDFQLRHFKEGGPDQSKYFEGFLEQHPGLKDPATIEMKSQNVDPNQPTVQATITSKSGLKTLLSLKLRMGLSGTWKVDEVAVLKEDSKKDGESKKQDPPKDAGKN
jgi:hypothetical protein